MIKSSNIRSGAPEQAKIAGNAGDEKQSDHDCAQDADLSNNTSQPPAAKHRKLVFLTITLALMSAIFLAALDVNILCTHPFYDPPLLYMLTTSTRFTFVAIVIPSITTEFGSLDDVSWYGAAYSLTKMALQPTFGRTYYLWPLKPVFCSAIAVFTVGSIICATAPSSTVLIVGRAIQGIGSAGLFSGALTLAAFAVSKKKLPLFISILSSMYAVASVLGPIIGGYVTESHLSWRFCFWINLRKSRPTSTCPHMVRCLRFNPMNIAIAAVPVIIIMVFYTEPKRDTTKAKLAEKLAAFDPIGTVLLIGAVVTLILALQWGGTRLPWSHPGVWGTLLATAVFVGLFTVVQIKLKER
jgi:MFS family permease